MADSAVRDHSAPKTCAAPGGGRTGSLLTEKAGVAGVHVVTLRLVLLTRLIGLT